MASYFALAKEDLERARALRPGAMIVIDFALKPGEWYQNVGNVPLPPQQMPRKAVPFPVHGRGGRRG